MAEGSFRARNNGRSTDNVRTDWGVDQSTFRLAGHVDWSQSIVLKNEISCFNCYKYVASRCALRNVDLKSWVKYN